MSDNRSSRDLDKIIVRLPDGMRDRLADAAKANSRSVNAEVVTRLEQSLGLYKSDSDNLQSKGVRTLKEVIEVLRELQKAPDIFQHLLAMATVNEDD